MDQYQGTSQLDISELSQQIQEYSSNLQTTIDQDNENSEMPHYSQINQMLSHFTQLSEHLIDKSGEFVRQIQELNAAKGDIEHKLSESESIIQSLEDEIQTQEQRIGHLKVDSQQFEAQATGAKEELRQANEAILQYKDLNDDLCVQLEGLSKNQTTQDKKEDDSQKGKLVEQSENIRALQLKIQSQEMQEKDYIKELQSLKAANEDWEQKTKQVLVQIQQNEIMQEKKEYESQLRINEMISVYKDQKSAISQYQDQVMLLKHEKSVMESQKQLELQASPQRDSYMRGSLTSNNPQMNQGSFIKMQNTEVIHEEREEGAQNMQGEMRQEDGLNEQYDDVQVEVQESDDHSDGPKNEFEGFENDFQAFNAGGDNRSDFIALGQGNNSRPGSFLEPQVPDDINQPDAEQEYRSNSDGENSLGEVNVQLDDDPVQEEKQTAQTTVAKSKGGSFVMNNQMSKTDSFITPQKDIRAVSQSFIVRSPVPAVTLRGSVIDTNPITEIQPIAVPEIVKEASLRRNPEEEYFMLAVLAHKMIHTEDHEAEYIYEINAQKLLQQVKALKIPFHRWYQWLGTRFDQLQLVHKKEEELRQMERRKWEEQQNKNREKVETPKPSGMGIFDKIYKFMNRESKEEREEREQQELEADRKLLMGGATVNRGYKSARGVPGEIQSTHVRKGPGDLQNNNQDAPRLNPLSLPQSSDQMAPMPSLGQITTEPKLKQYAESEEQPLSARDRAYSLFGTLGQSVSSGLEQARIAKEAYQNSPEMSFTATPEKEKDQNNIKSNAEYDQFPSPSGH